MGLGFICNLNMPHICVSNDTPVSYKKKNHNILSKYLDLQGLAINKGKTYFDSW